MKLQAHRHHHFPSSQSLSILATTTTTTTTTMMMMKSILFLCALTCLFSRVLATSSGKIYDSSILCLIIMFIL
jgi:hypothetical protein